MASLVETLTTIRTKIRRRCDQENSTYVSDTEIAENINTSYAHLVDEIHDNADTEGLLSWYDGATVAGTDTYPVSGSWPAPEPPQNDVYRIAGVDIQFDGQYRRIDKWRFTRRDAHVDASGWSGPGDTFYRIHRHLRATGATEIRFFPVPGGVHNFRVWYMPIAPEVDGTIPIVSLNGWAEFVVADVCAMILEKGDDDESPFIRRRDRALQRVIWAAANLDDSGMEGIREDIDWGNGGRRLHSEENSEWS